MKRILMCGSTLDTKGGMVSVAKNYLHYDKWDDVYIKYVPTHFDTNKYLLVFYFCLRYLQIVFLVLCGHFDIAHLHTVIFSMDSPPTESPRPIPGSRLS